MRRSIIFKIVSLVLFLFGFSLCITAASSPRNEEAVIPGSISLFLSIISFFISNRFKKNEVELSKIQKVQVENNNSKSILNDNLTRQIPGVCPHCKSPNVKRFDVCEYCGNPTI